jgi:O-acetyl-ADP-ribose deacetylase (regulator of RNase III)
MTPSFEAVFVDENPDVVNALAAAFGRNFPESVRFVPGNIFSCGPGTLVSPTNAEGDMSAGLDLQLCTMFPHLETRLQEYIHELPSKRLSVGAAVWVETGEPRHPLVIFAPTFRAPWDLASLNRISRAAFAVFVSVQANNLSGKAEPIRRILMPGFGTGVGGIEPIEAARKMFDAYRRALTIRPGTIPIPRVLKNQGQYPQFPNL